MSITSWSSWPTSSSADPSGPLNCASVTSASSSTACAASGPLPCPACPPPGKSRPNAGSTADPGHDDRASRVSQQEPGGQPERVDEVAESAGGREHDHQGQPGNQPPARRALV